jgi:hypothetical protein
VAETAECLYVTAVACFVVGIGAGLALDSGVEKVALSPIRGGLTPTIWRILLPR